MLDYYTTKWHSKRMRRVFKTRHFARWMRKTELTNPAVCKAVAETAEGLIDADLGGDVLKKRVALPGRGKSGGIRTLVATRKGTRWFCRKPHCGGYLLRRQRKCREQLPARSILKTREPSCSHYLARHRWA